MDRLGRCALRGALIGAPVLGLAGLMAGLAAMSMRLPVPTIAVTELGAMAGALLGAGVGAICASRTGRFALLGGLAGLLLAMGVAALLGGGVPWRFAVLFALLGAQGGTMLRRPPRGGPRSVVGMARAPQNAGCGGSP